jgi:hypothetical protein
MTIGYVAIFEIRSYLDLMPELPAQSCGDSRAYSCKRLRLVSVAVLDWIWMRAWRVGGFASAARRHAHSPRSCDGLGEIAEKDFVGREVPWLNVPVKMLVEN